MTQLKLNEAKTEPDTARKTRHSKSRHTKLNFTIK